MEIDSEGRKIWKGEEKRKTKNQQEKKREKQNKEERKQKQRIILRVKEKSNRKKEGKK